MPQRKYQNLSQQRVLKVLDTLFGHEITGISPAELCKITGLTPTQATRDLANLKAFGWAEQNEKTGRWYVSARMVQKALAALDSIEHATQKVKEMKRRYTRY